MDGAASARAVIDANRYMTLGTADESGLPSVSPVWFAAADYREFFWVSLPDRRHSRNVAVRPQLSIVIFDSTQPVGNPQAVYLSAVAEQLTGGDLAEGIRVFSGRSEACGRGRATTSCRAPATACTAQSPWRCSCAGDRTTGSPWA
jgi:Pyridoxamine 5'-phosphate oxidase